MEGRGGASLTALPADVPERDIDFLTAAFSLLYKERVKGKRVLDEAGATPSDLFIIL